jgi:hypothetical protein
MQTAYINTTYHTNKAGYARKKYKGKLEYHRRIVCAEATNTDLTTMQNLVVRHSCDNPSCVNPKHLILGTHKDNTQDAVSRGRNHVPPTKLTAAQVAEILQTCDLSHRALATKYGVSRATSSRLKKV